MEREPAKLHELSEQHLAEEEAHLDATLHLLRQTRTALLAGSTPALSDILARQRELALTDTKLRQKRDQFRRRAASLLGVTTESLCLSMLSDHFPTESKSRLAQTLQRLCQKMTEVERLRQSSAVLISSYLELVDQALLQVTGDQAGSGQYSSAGMRQTPTYDPIIETRG